MVGGSPTRLCRLALALVLAAAAEAQEQARWIADLGDPQVGEAAERALLQLGDKASKPLEDLLEAWDTTTPRDVERLRAALRVVDLLGEPVAGLAPIVTAIGKRETKQLSLELFTARASLYPYAKDDAWPRLFHMAFRGTDTEMFQAMTRMAARMGVANVGDVEAMRAALERDDIFAREVAAEALGKLGDTAAIEPLRVRLLDRDRRPNGWDQIRHNGFVVPSDDQFRLRAGASLVLLAPDDPRSTIGLACLALLHPHRTVRLESLRSLARFGPDVDAAVPELLQIAQRNDAELAAEALKVLGMAGRAVGLHLAAIENLAIRAHGPVQKLASGLAARLRAMGITPVNEAPDVEAVGAQQELALATAALSDLTEDVAAAAENKLLDAGAKAWPMLVARYRAEQNAASDRVLRLLGRLGQSQPEGEREEVRFALASQGDTWSGPSMSTSSGGGQMRFVHQEAYARLTMGSPATLEALTQFLVHDNAVVRLVAARDLAGRRAEIAAPADGRSSAAESVREALFGALHVVHPEKSLFASGKHNRQWIALDLDTEIEAAAAAALLDCEALADNWPALLRKILPYGDAAVVALAIERWACPAVAAELTEATKDRRPQVAQAAAQALLRLRAGK